MLYRRSRSTSTATEREPARSGPSSGSGMPQFMRDDVMERGGAGEAEASLDAGSGMDAGVADAAPVDSGIGLPGGVEHDGIAPVPPSGPDACATIEEEERKSRFEARSFSAPDFRPSAGFGKFDAYYWPRLSLMAAVVKMKFNYVQADDTPSLGVLIQMAAAGQDIRRFFWTEAEKRQFAADYVDTVSRHWSFAHTFRSRKPCWPFAAEPHVTPRVVEDKADAHFDVTVHKTSTFRGSDFSARNPGTPGWQGTGNLDSLDPIDIADHHSTDVARSERQRLERAVATAGASPVRFAKGSAALDPGAVASLAALADLMKARNPSDPDVPMVCAGFASAEGDAGFNSDLAQRRAEAVAAELRRAGVPQPVAAAGRGAVGLPDDAANRRVDLAPDATFEGGYAGNAFSPAAHEFGHAIGLPDEYVNRTSGVLGDKQTAFVNLAQAAGVAPPDRWGDETSSLMSVGVDVLPRHYLTIWEALGSMTAPDISRDEWSID